jgi:anti-sigma regulatory factor (Ser/Thr protein kinase)
MTQRLMDHCFAPDTAQLEPVRHRLRTALEAYGCDHEFTQSSVLAVDEAVSNVMRHGRWPEADARLRLTVKADGAKVTFSLRDSAESFDPTAVDLPAAGEARAGGYGLLIVQSIMDSVRYSSGAAGEDNVLEMTRRLVPSPERQ